MKPKLNVRPDFESLVEQHYVDLYRFAFSLTRGEAQASDLTQQAFYIWAEKGHQLRDPSKAKTWLFTTLHREFLRVQKRQARFSHRDLEDVVQAELPQVEPTAIAQLDAKKVLKALARLDGAHQAPLALFYLQGKSYKEVAETLEIPVGTAQSRIARGKARLHRMLTDGGEGA